jgi:anionic cell wall polymer biosynthesis LytR-Cps2A-Psr (LCP) family protein
MPRPASVAERPAELDDPPPPKRKRTPLWTKLLIIAGALMMVISGATLVTVRIFLKRATDSIEQIQIDAGDSGVASGQALKGTMNILLVGVDDGVVEGVDTRDISKEGVRADSIMILHIPATHDRGYLVSLPRDLWVRVPKFPKTGYGGGMDKLNSAYNHGYGNQKGGGPGRSGGLELLMLTIKDATGISLNAAATVNFTGFTNAVKILGGVTMTIDERVESVHYGFDKNGQQCIPALFDDNAIAHRRSGCKPRTFERGTRRLTAEEALDYTRQREWMELEDGDYGRQRHQQQFIKALLAEAKTQGLTGNMPKTLSLITAVGNALSMWTNGQKVEDWFFTLKDIAGTDLVMIKTNNGQFTPADISGTSAEALSDDSKKMLAALRDGTIEQWLGSHFDWVGTSN